MKNLAILAGLMACATTASYGQVWLHDYELLDGVTTGFSYSYAPNANSSTHVNVAGAGAGGTVGKLVTVNFAGPGNNFSGFGAGDNFGAPTMLGAMGTDLSLISAFVDVRVVESTWTDIDNAPHSNFSVTVQFQAADDAIAPDVDTDPDLALSIRFNALNATDSFLTYGGLLSTGELVAGSAANLPLAFQAVFILEWNKGNIAFFAMGEDAGNQVAIDNMMLTQVPEASTTALMVGAGALALAVIRRRRA